MIEVVDADELSYSDFCARFLATNTPVKLRNTTHRWFAQAVALWTTAVTDEHGNTRSTINHAALKSLYGHAIVPVRCITTCSMHSQCLMGCG